MENNSGRLVQPGTGASSSGGIRYNTSETREDPLPTSSKMLVGQTFEENRNEIWSWLMDYETSIIGIHGIGNTTMSTMLLDCGESSRPREKSEWILLMTNLILEIVSAVFDQLGYALIGMVLAYVALLLATVELVHMALKERVKHVGRSPLLIFRSPSTNTFATGKPVGTIVEYYGLAGAVWQSFYSTAEYTYARQKKDNPIKMSLLPFIFLLCVVISKLIKN